MMMMIRMMNAGCCHKNLLLLLVVGINKWWVVVAGSGQLCSTGRASESAFAMAPESVLDAISSCRRLWSPLGRRLTFEDFWELCGDFL